MIPVIFPRRSLAQSAQKQLDPKKEKLFCMAEYESVGGQGFDIPIYCFNFLPNY